jgi:hypothetical protein
MLIPYTGSGLRIAVLIVPHDLSLDERFLMPAVLAIVEVVAVPAASSRMLLW